MLYGMGFSGGTCGLPVKNKNESSTWTVNNVWVPRGTDKGNKGFGMYICVCATRHLKDHLPSYLFSYRS